MKHLTVEEVEKLQRARRLIEKVKMSVINRLQDQDADTTKIDYLRQVVTALVAADREIVNVVLAQVT